MKKILAALAVAMVGGIAAYFSPEAAWNVFLGFAILNAAIVISWAITSLFPAGHGVTAKLSGFGASMSLGYFAWGLGEGLAMWALASVVPAALAPKLYEKLFRTDNAARALLTVVAAKCGVRLRWDTSGNLSGVGVGEDKTVGVWTRPDGAPADAVGDDQGETKP
jgi:hypothetical protein